MMAYSGYAGAGYHDLDDVKSARVIEELMLGEEQLGGLTDALLLSGAQHRCGRFGAGAPA